MKILKVIVDEELPKSCKECGFKHNWETKCYCHIKSYTTNKRNHFIGEYDDIKGRHKNCPLIYNG